MKITKQCLSRVTQAFFKLFIYKFCLRSFNLDSSTYKSHFIVNNLLLFLFLLSYNKTETSLIYSRRSNNLILSLICLKQSHQCLLDNHCKLSLNCTDYLLLYNGLVCICDHPYAFFVVRFPIILHRVVLYCHVGVIQI